jgi:uncharacterized protein YmfQ (DUF2313 family)
MTTCTVTPEEYARALRQLMPPGPAMQYADAENLAALLLSLGDSYATFHSRTCDLLREIIPNTTVEMLPDWERVAGLPDECTGEASTLDARRRALSNKLRLLGGQSIAYFIELAAALGYTITISEYSPLVAGLSRAGDRLTNDGDQVAPYGWQFVWLVKADSVVNSRLRAGIGTAGEPLQVFGNAILQCILNKWKPAHTLVIFDYSALEQVLLLNFLGGSPVGVTCNRADAATCATRVNAAGFVESVAANLPRVDYDPITKAPLGVLIEPSRTNHLLASSDFGNATWNKNGLTITTDTVATLDPSGGNTSDKLEETAISSTHSVVQTRAGLDASQVHTFSSYAKAAERGFLRLSIDRSGATANFIRVRFNLSTGAVVQTETGGNGQLISANAVDVGNGWWRLSITGIPDITTGTGGIRGICFVNDSAAGGNSYLGVAGSGIYLWGAQLEVGDFATSLIQTTTATLTRAAESLTYSMVGLSNPDEGCLLVQARPLTNVPTAQIVAAIDDGTVNDRVGIFLDQSGAALQARAQVNDGGTARFNAALGDAASVALAAPFKATVAYKLASYAGAVNGAGPVTGTDPNNLPESCNTLRIGLDAAAGNPFFGHIQTIAYWNGRPNDTNVREFSA